MVSRKTICAGKAGCNPCPVGFVELAKLYELAGKEPREVYAVLVCLESGCASGRIRAQMLVLPVPSGTGTEEAIDLALASEEVDALVRTHLGSDEWADYGLPTKTIEEGKSLVLPLAAACGYNP